MKGGAPKRGFSNPSQGGCHTPGRFTYDIKTDHIYKSTNVLSQDFPNLMTHAKRHFKNEVRLKMTMIGKKRKIIKANVKQENIKLVC